MVCYFLYKLKSQHTHEYILSKFIYRLDALATAGPLEAEVSDPSKIDDVFDDLSYSKVNIFRSM